MEQAALAFLPSAKTAEDVRETVTGDAHTFCLGNCKHSHLLDSDGPGLVTPHISCAHLTHERIKLSFELPFTDLAQAYTACTDAEFETTGLAQWDAHCHDILSSTFLWQYP